MAYNPYESASKIVDNKRKWANAKAKGEDTSAYEKDAAVYYQDLRDNGRGDVADYLQKSDSVTAGDYLKTFTPDYKADAGSLQQKSNDVYGVTKGQLDTVNKDYDKVYANNINVTPTRTEYGKDILKGYGIAADEAYKGTLGGGASDNGGNVDSYAAANANRQKAAVVSQGYGDVLDYYNSIAGNSLTWAGDKANAVGTYLDRLQGNIADDRGVVNKAFEGTVDLWKTQDTNRTSGDIAKIESGTRKYESDNSLKGTMDYNSTLRYDSDNNVKVAEIQAKYGVDVARVTAEAEKYGWDTQRIINSDNLSSKEKLAALELKDAGVGGRKSTTGDISVPESTIPESTITADTEEVSSDVIPGIDLASVQNMTTGSTAYTTALEVARSASGGIAPEDVVYVLYQNGMPETTARAMLLDLGLNPDDYLG